MFCLSFVILIVIQVLLSVIGLRVMNWSLENKKKKGNAQPLLKIADTDLSIAWRSLLHREFLVDVTLENATVRLIDSLDREKRQLGTEESAKDLRSVFDVIITVSVESLKVKNSSVYFINTS